MYLEGDWQSPPVAAADWSGQNLTGVSTLLEQAQMVSHKVPPSGWVRLDHHSYSIGIRKADLIMLTPSTMSINKNEAIFIFIILHFYLFLHWPRLAPVACTSLHLTWETELYFPRRLEVLQPLAWKTVVTTRLVSEKYYWSIDASKTDISFCYNGGFI